MRVVNGKKMMPSTGHTNDVNVASIRSGRAIQKMISAARGKNPANKASRQPMRPASTPAARGTSPGPDEQFA